MIRNWKTTIAGFIAAIANLVANGVSLKSATVSAGLALIGSLAADGAKFLSILFVVSAFVSFPMDATAQTTTIVRRVSDVIPNDQIQTVSFTIGNGLSTNQVKVVIKPLDRSGNVIPGVIGLVKFTDNPGGTGVTATASSGTVGLSDTTGSGVYTGNGHIVGVTQATPTVTNTRIPTLFETDFKNGYIAVSALDSAKTLFYVVFELSNGRKWVSPKLATADYK